MKKKEVYRSFEGNLGLGEDGYIVYEITDYYEIHTLTTRAGIPENTFRVNKSVAQNTDWSDRYYIGKYETGVKDGRIDGQFLYKNVWYSTEKIHDMQKEHKDYNWMRYC